MNRKVSETSMIQPEHHILTLKSIQHISGFKVYKYSNFVIFGIDIIQHKSCNERRVPIVKLLPAGAQW